MNSITISHCHVKSSKYPSHPNGELQASGMVNYYLNQNPANPYNSTKVGEIKVENPNNVVFFAHKELSVQAIRGIANSLLELAIAAEAAQVKLIKLNKEVDNS